MTGTLKNKLKIVSLKTYTGIRNEKTICKRPSFHNINTILHSFN